MCCPVLPSTACSKEAQVHAQVAAAPLPCASGRTDTNVLPAVCDWRPAVRERCCGAPHAPRCSVGEAVSRRGATGSGGAAAAWGAGDAGVAGEHMRMDCLPPARAALAGG